MLRYASLGRARKLRAALEVDAGLVATTDASGSTPLHAACRHGHADCVTLLLRCVRLWVVEKGTDGSLQGSISKQDGCSRMD